MLEYIRPVFQITFFYSRRCSPKMNVVNPYNLVLLYTQCNVFRCINRQFKAHKFSYAAPPLCHMFHYRNPFSEIRLIGIFTSPILQYSFKVKITVKFYRIGFCTFIRILPMAKYLVIVKS